jgi:formylglycine-generating enzyme required for sulfatase activity
MMKISTFINSTTFGISLLLIAISLGACSSEKAAEQIAHNADWEPVTRRFGDVEMVKVPSGCFTMGSDYGRRDEIPMTEICFDQPFWIDRYEVTNGQYGSDGPFPGTDQPHTNQTWFEAAEFCERRGARLPTEAEWEYAARGPDNLIYPWGNELIADNLVFDQNTPGGVAAVGSRPEGVSWVGAYDMSGNVWEWVSSIYAPYPYRADDGREDRQNDTSRRVYRSGINSYIDYGVSTSIRFWLRPFKRDWFIGFRCAKSE